MIRALLLAATLAPLPLPAMAAPYLLALTPGNMLARTTTTALLLSNTGTFRQLYGTMRFDPAMATCGVDVTFVVDSLDMPSPLLRTKAMSPAFMDAARYPLEHYVASCRGAVLAGFLTMHGQTHPFDMALTYNYVAGVPVSIHTAGRLDRTAWAITGMNLLVGKTVRVTNDIMIPPAGK